MIRISKQTLVNKEKKEKDSINRLSENSKNGDKTHTLDTIVNQDPSINPKIGQFRSSYKEKEEVTPFELSKSFLNKYSKMQPPFGFGDLGEIVYRRTYSRLKADDSNEEWFETVGRVINGTYTLQKRWIEDRGLRWDNNKGQRSAQERYEKIFNMKYTTA